ncbi:hypothetical protein L3X37_12630 [Sabulilitoribacter arenilitoris]|uniref:DUF7486 domain-containing protein n=1 Tax=Wocania arenilitoris TaxID=2044858 RepID=A0AAE3EQ88_9FLAO|nr:hypothetical protein [Wocania arenilitoris]MCF7569201.1 hypothetical protein [Wocania arenilitoris]
MEKSRHYLSKTVFNYLFLLGFLFLFTACKNDSLKAKTTTKEIAKVNDILWNVNAVLPDGTTLDIKAIDKEGNLLNIKAIQNSDQSSFLNVKAFVGNKKLPVKMLVSKDKLKPIKAFNGGDVYDIKAITPEGEKLDVKGVARFENIVLIKAISKKGEFYGVKAISPTGEQNDIKGIKINSKDREMSLNGVDIHAHIKAMHPAANEDDFEISGKSKKKKESEFKRIIWNIKAVTPEGKNLNVKAFDADGNKFDVKAIQDSKQHSFINIKAFVDGYALPVKILDSKDEYSPIVAIGTDGKIYNIKAITETDAKLDVKGISRSGNLIHVKAIGENENFYGVKAFAPDGKLNDVKGIKIFERKVELTVQGNPVYAHLKAITQ